MRVIFAEARNFLPSAFFFPGSMHTPVGRAFPIRLFGQVSNRETFGHTMPMSPEFGGRGDRDSAQPLTNSGSLGTPIAFRR
jgi:hypothetical protein